MQMIFDSPPKVGETFNLHIYTDAKPAHVLWFIEGNLIRRHDCPDPPCHEQMFIQPEYSHKELRIVGTDRVETKELVFHIKEEDPSPYAMARA